MYLNYWVSVFQLLMGIPLSIPSAPLQGSQIPDIPRDLFVFSSVFPCLKVGVYPPVCVCVCVFFYL